MKYKYKFSTKKGNCFTRTLNFRLKKGDFKGSNVKNFKLIKKF